MRYHKISVAFFDKFGEAAILKDVFINNKAETRIDIANYSECAAFLLNCDDKDFVKIILDKKSLDFFDNNLDKIEDSLMQRLILNSVSEMVKISLISPSFILNFVKSNLSSSLDSDIVISGLTQAIILLKHYSSDKDANMNSLNKFIFKII